MTSPYLEFGAFVALLFGTVVGSFLNVCIYRLPRGESIATPPSHCPKCSNRLQPADLVPILSFLALRGRCRYCGERISWRYAIVEAITGVLFALVWLSPALRPDVGPAMWSPAGVMLVAAGGVFVAAMLVTFVIDLETMYVLEPVVWTATLAGVGYELAKQGLLGEVPSAKLFGMEFVGVPSAVPGMVLGFAVFVAFDILGRLVFRKPGMGMGDAYIGAAAGAMLGAQNAALSFGVAVGAGAVVGVVWLVVQNARRRKEAKAGRDAEVDAPVMDLPLWPSLLGLLALVAAGFVACAASLWLTPWLRGGGAGAFVFAAVAGALPVGALVLASRAAPAEEVVEGEAEEEPGESYMPFGPFLAASAVLVMLAPSWFGGLAQRLWEWLAAGGLYGG